MTNAIIRVIFKYRRKGRKGVERTSSSSDLGEMIDGSLHRTCAYVLVNEPFSVVTENYAHDHRCVCWTLYSDGRSRACKCTMTAVCTRLFRTKHGTIPKPGSVSQY